MSKFYRTKITRETVSTAFLRQFHKDPKKNIIYKVHMKNQKRREEVRCVVGVSWRLKLTSCYIHEGRFSFIKMKDKTVE